MNGKTWKTDRKDPEVDDDETDDETDDEDDLEDEFVPEAPDGGQGWVVMFASLLCNFIVDGIGYAFGILLSELAEHFGESKGKVSLIGSLLFGGYLCSGK